MGSRVGNIIAPEQYGSCKLMRVIVHVLNKRLVTSILQQKRIPSGICSCDLK